MGAGVYEAGRNLVAMYQSERCIESIHYGSDLANFYLRVDFQKGVALPAKASLRVSAGAVAGATAPGTAAGVLVPGVVGAAGPGAVAGALATGFGAGGGAGGRIFSNRNMTTL